MNLIDGKYVSQRLKESMQKEVATMVCKPYLVAILVGNDGASETYVGHKEKMCNEIGLRSSVLRFSANISQDDLLGEIAKLNADDDVDGFIVQMPLPKHIDDQAIIEAIHPSKDVDGFHPENVGRMVIGLDGFVSATPMGICDLIKFYGIETSGKNCVVIGRSNIVGRPMSNLLSSKEFDATVTVCHSRTKNLKEVCSNADIIVAALGKAEFVTADMVKEGAVVIDVGITRVSSDKTKNGWKLVGDVNFDQVANKCSWITPVPGGVGPMTIISLMKNTIKAAKKRQNE